MALSGLTPAAYGSATATETQSVVAIPAGGTLLVINNMGGSPAAVLLQTGSTPPNPPVSMDNGVLVKATDPPLILTVGSNDHIAIVALGYGNAQLNLTVGA